MPKKIHTDKLLAEIRGCAICKKYLPFKPKPILDFESSSKILIVGQAPGIRAHESGKPWDDASGDRLRDWLGVSADIFYDPKIVAIVPMGFCYPGKGKSGDLPPRPECSEKWMGQVLKHLKKIELKIIIGKYAQEYFLSTNDGVTESVRNQDMNSGVILLPHPSPRNNIWLKKNPWFGKRILPVLKKRVVALV